MLLKEKAVPLLVKAENMGSSEARKLIAETIAAGRKKFAADVLRCREEGSDFVDQLILVQLTNAEEAKAAKNNVF